MNFIQFLQESTSTTGLSGKAEQYYNSAIEYFRKELKIPANTKVNVHFNYDHDFGQGHNGSTLPDLHQDNAVNVYLRDGLDRATLMKALGHEMVHVEQMANKRLNLEIVDGQLKSIEWEGEPQKSFNYNRNAEWELEAHSMENQLMRGAIQAVGNLM